MKKIFFFAAAMAATVSASAQFAKFDATAKGLVDATSAAVELTSTDVLAETETFTASVAFVDNYSLKTVKHNEFVQFAGTDGVALNEATDTLGLQGSNNPKDADGGNPANAMTVAAGGAVFKVTAKADGYLYIFHKASSNKQYVVLEGDAAGMTHVNHCFGMVTTDKAGFFGVVDSTVVIEYTIEGNNEYGQITDGRKIYFAEDYAKDPADTTNFGVAVYKQNGLGAIGVPCYAGMDYWFHATGSKMTALGVAYFATPQNINALKADGTSVQILAASSMPVAGAAEGIENTAAQVKATKVMENGKVVIIRGDVRYNVLGTVIE